MFTGVRCVRSAFSSHSLQGTRLRVTEEKELVRLVLAESNTEHCSGDRLAIFL